jgi:hypothetical protein
MPTKPEFPQPIDVDGRPRYLFSQVSNYVAQCAGLPQRRFKDTDAMKLLTAGQVCELLGVSDMFLRRRTKKRPDEIVETAEMAAG